MKNEYALAVVRHGLTAGGVTGLLSSDEMEMLAGAIATLIGLGWSFYRKWKRANA